MLREKHMRRSCYAFVAFSAAVLLMGTGPMKEQMEAHAAEPSAEANLQEIDLEAYTRAYPRVEGVRQQYIPAIKEAETRDEKRQLMQQAHKSMKEVIQEEGLTVEEYSRASVAISRDPELKDAVVQRLETTR